MAAMGGAATMMSPQMPGQVVDHAKLHLAERDSLALIGANETAEGIRWVGDRVEARVLALYLAT